jgi:dTDP-4-amino-4,6-dideoxygalactose transaminase
MGDGGAILTSDAEIARHCRRLRDHGRLEKDVHAEVGFNLRFNELQAAALRVLLRRLDTMNERRRALAASYARGLAGLPLVTPATRPHARHVYHLFVVRTPRRAELAAFLKERGIQTGIHYPIPTHRQPAVERFATAPLPRTEQLVDEILSLPMSADHTDEQIDRVIASVRAFFGA